MYLSLLKKKKPLQLLCTCVLSVIEAGNGLQAWKILEDLTNHVDLVLTEVVMPCLSGVGLLYKIMSHKTRKNVPVISKFFFFFFLHPSCNSFVEQEQNWL